MLLICAELAAYLTANVQTEMVLDTNAQSQIHISLNITFHALACAQAKLDVMDVAGTQVLDLAHLEIHKQRLDARGARLGKAAVVSSGKAAATPEPPVMQMLKMFFPGLGAATPQGDPNPNREGCLVSGTLHVNKVAGNLHFAIGQTMVQGNRHVHHFTIQDLQVRRRNPFIYLFFFVSAFVDSGVERGALLSFQN